MSYADNPYSSPGIFAAHAEVNERRDVLLVHDTHLTDPFSSSSVERFQEPIGKPWNVYRDAVGGAAVDCLDDAVLNVHHLN